MNQPPSRTVALVGNPNCGKTALFNALTGARQKVANYAGVTVERKFGMMKSRSAQTIYLTDLPGIYSIQPHSLEEEVTLKVLQGQYPGEVCPDAVVMVLDATHLLRGLRLLKAIFRLGLPVVVAVNFMDIARQSGRPIDIALMEKVLGVPVVATVAIHPHGAKPLAQAIVALTADDRPTTSNVTNTDNAADLQADHQGALAWMHDLGLSPNSMNASHVHAQKVDALLMHPLWGVGILMLVLFVMFQSVFSLAEWPNAGIEAVIAAISHSVSSLLPDSLLKNLLIDGVIAGVGGVLVFMPQILILFFFIIVLEEMGYLPRAALLMDRLMGRVGLSGRAFIPLLSSFACAIPGIMATRTIPDAKSRWLTVMLAPLMTCSARIPVYVLLISAFIPPLKVAGFLELQGLVMFFLYVLGVVSAMGVALLLRIVVRLPEHDTLIMELPDYRWPYWRNVVMGLWWRAMIFLKRMGTTILLISIVLWFISNYPNAPENAKAAPIEYSYAGQLGKAIAPIFAPIGFNWQISVSLVPGIAAREVMVSALSTVYAVEAAASDSPAPASATNAKPASGDDNGALIALLSAQWGLPTALSLLAWFVYAPMCFPTIVTVRKELSSLSAAIFMACYQFVLAYAAAWLTYRLALTFWPG